MAYKIIVIGGANADIAGTPSHPFTLHDSIPGRVTLTPGGVGRNIAENLVRRQAEVRLVAAFGDDFAGDAIRKSCEELGIDLSLAKLCPGRKSSVYLCISDNTGDMVSAISDMDITEEISPEYIAGILGEIRRCDACVIDANLREDTIEYIAANAAVPLYADPVSAVKAVRLQGVLDRLAAVKPNRYELPALGEVPCKCFVSLGPEGMEARYRGEICRVPAPKLSAVSTNGCGDAAMAAIVLADLQGLSLRETAEAAVRSATERILSQLS